MDTQLRLYQPAFTALAGPGPTALDHRIKRVWRGKLGFRFCVEIDEEYFESADSMEIQTLLDIHDAATLVREDA